jgi:hypothetical protein
MEESPGAKDSSITRSALPIRVSSEACYGSYGNLVKM